MVPYFYKLTPLFTIGAICLLALPWLGLIALMVVVLFGLPAIAFTIVWMPYRIVRAFSRDWHDHKGAQPQPAATLSVPARHPDAMKGPMV
jgi:uncharacterized membrane protein